MNRITHSLYRTRALIRTEKRWREGREIDLAVAQFVRPKTVPRLTYSERIPPIIRARKACSIRTRRCVERRGTLPLFAIAIATVARDAAATKRSKGRCS